MKEPNINKNIKKLKISFLGKDDWKKMRDLMVLKMSECETEEQFAFLMEAMLSAMFRNVKELEKARKRIGNKLLTKIEKDRIEKKLKEKNGNK